MNSYDDTRPRRTQAPNLHGPKISNPSSSSSPSEGGSVIGQKEKVRKEDNSFACRIHEHVKLGPNIPKTVKGKLQLGVKIIQRGGRRENLFRKLFVIKEGEKMLKASQCYLSTTTGPIAGLLFISTEKVAFCSEKSITAPSPQFTTTSSQQIVTPVSKIQRVSRGENKENTAQKFIEIVIEDNVKHRFMGFLHYEKAFHNLEVAIARATRS
ncbi:hypothetical protein I3843_16G070100 [Carya illinoinensis]|uniref:GRAM domain-containing protein n=1 Tax=Carya illinoinensis TaxID=32201 RepID=A0A8T1N7V5_CARIL|nr:putative GEM-like protein 8 isoform X2 [Carya illinoinensis]KAG6625127.1 hypothetical protein CIPAW_16G074600 [Carya illinoinensis]KAG7941882.1 hypothetical protein I3843_16G070100 [Carya illinoinensis]